MAQKIEFGVRWLDDKKCRWLLDLKRPRLDCPCESPKGTWFPSLRVSLDF